MTGKGRDSRRLLNAPGQSFLSFGHTLLINIAANEPATKIQAGQGSRESATASINHQLARTGEKFYQHLNSIKWLLMVMPRLLSTVHPDEVGPPLLLFPLAF